MSGAAQQAGADTSEGVAPPPSGPPSRPPPSPEEVAPVVKPLANWAVVGIFILLLIGAMAYARNFLMPVVLALMLKLVFTPLQRWLERLGVPGGLAATGIVGSLLGGILILLMLLANPVTDWVNRAPILGMQIEAKLGELRWATEGMREAAAQVQQITEGESDPDVQLVRVENQDAFTYALTVPQVAAQVVFTLVLLFFLLASGDMFYEKIVHVMPTFRDKKTAIRIAHDIEQKLSHYLSTITLINAGLGVATGAAMWLLGMPNPLLFGVIAFVLNYIPYLGAITGVVITLVVGIVSLDEIGQAVTAAAVYFLLTSIEGQLITPYSVGRRLRLNTVVVFIGVTLMAWLWSVIGMVVATPLLVMIRTFCEHIPRLEPVGSFLSARGAERESPEEANGPGKT